MFLGLRQPKKVPTVVVAFRSAAPQRSAKVRSVYLGKLTKVNNDCSFANIISIFLKRWGTEMYMYEYQSRD